MMLRNPVRTPSRPKVVYVSSCRNEDLHHFLQDDPNSSESVFPGDLSSQISPTLGLTSQNSTCFGP